jgi:hypothetical protein
MDWLSKLLEFIFLATQVSAGAYLAYGGYLFVQYLALPSIRDEKSDPDTIYAEGQPALT